MRCTNTSFFLIPLVEEHIQDQLNALKDKNIVEEIVSIDFSLKNNGHFSSFKIKIQNYRSTGYQQSGT